jgi:hypothetical protein
MRLLIVSLAILVILAACSKGSKKESEKECFPIIDKAVSSLEKFGLKLDTTNLDSALTYYDDAIRCDSAEVNRHPGNKEELADVGRYRESLTVIDNVFKVRDVPTSRDAHFMMIKGWLYGKLGEKDSAQFYVEMLQRIMTPE